MRNHVKPCPIYTVGDGTKTQVACRDDGQWFMRTRERKELWGPWREQPKRPFEFGLYIDRKAGNARLPHAGENDAC